MSSSNHNSTPNFDIQPANHGRLDGALPIYIRNEDGGNFLSNVPKKPRSKLLENKTKPSRKIVRCCISSSDEGDSKEIPSLTKILIGTCFAAILTPQVTTNSMTAKLEILFEWVAILSMMVGMYIQSKRPKLSNWLQRIGHLNCLVGLIVMQGPLLQLPAHYVWIPPFGVALILGSAMFFQA